MAEPEELISDAARHATVFVQDMWRRHRKPDTVKTYGLVDVGPRLDLFLTAVFGEGFTVRAAQPPSHATLLGIVFHHDRAPRLTREIPATDGQSLWLPRDLHLQNLEQALLFYRTMGMQQALRAKRGSASLDLNHQPPLVRDVYLLLEAAAADRQLCSTLPGLETGVAKLKQFVLSQRPPVDKFPKARQPLERWLRELLTARLDDTHLVPDSPSPMHSLNAAHRIIADRQLLATDVTHRQLGPHPLLKDWWTGELRSPTDVQIKTNVVEHTDDADEDNQNPKTARINRRPEERAAKENEDEKQEQPAPLMVQLDEPHQMAEDPMGLQRPTDRDQDADAEEYGDMVSELRQARLVATPGKPKEVLLSDDPPDGRAKAATTNLASNNEGVCYPEWDWKIQAYREPGATVRVLPTATGNQQWVDATLATHKAMLNHIQRRFELLQARRVWHRKQVDGDEIDLDAFIDSYASLRAGGTFADGLYQSRRHAERNLAVSLLIDVSGSTDSWVAANRRVIDVEREALLLVCIALQGLGEPYAVQAFSGEGPQAVVVRHIKRFDEPYSNEVALRISSLEPEHYTRAGAALRHATVDLMQQPALHRLLLLLSDGKPNDRDDYEGRYGVEDMRQAITEATLQGISPFCLTIDRQAASYLPRVFGAHQYALLQHPERLPVVLLEWMKRLVVS